MNSLQKNELVLNKIHLEDCIIGMKQLPDNSIDIAIADPPYNLSKGGNWKWDNSVKLPGLGGNWNKVMQGWDNMPLYDHFISTVEWLSELKRVVKPTGSMWIHGTYHNIGLINFAMQMLEIEIINEVIWFKRNSFPNLSGRRLTASHETILWAHTGKPNSREYHFNYEASKELDFPEDKIKQPGKQMRTVWDIPNNKTKEELKYGKHPTQKPVRLIERMLRISSKKGDILLSPFSGAGTDCVVGKKLGLKYIGFELEKEYLDLSQIRLENTIVEDSVIKKPATKTADHEGKKRKGKAKSHQDTTDKQQKEQLSFETDFLENDLSGFKPKQQEENAEENSNLEPEEQPEEKAEENPNLEPEEQPEEKAEENPNLEPEEQPEEKAEENPNLEPEEQPEEKAEENPNLEPEEQQEEKAEENPNLEPEEQPEEKYYNSQEKTQLKAEKTIKISKADNFTPIPSILKWTGSKRKQANEIFSYFPKDYKRYIEPFLGGGAVLYLAGNEGSIANDIYKPVIEFWNLVQNDPERLINFYENEWNKLQQNLPDYYYEVRERFNTNPNGLDLSFLTRTCVNGIVRFNKEGEFNNSFHLSRKGMVPKTFGGIVNKWNKKIKGVNFTNYDYKEVLNQTMPGDIVYLDPPYAGSGNRYIENLNVKVFFEELEKLNRKDIKWMLSFDGQRGETNLEYPVPQDLYRRKTFLSNGNSTLNQVLNGQIHEVKEALYMNF
jgi:site-specific DNA-methyltransferase (adenine-specific)